MTEGLEAENWAEQEFGTAPLGDRRPADRLVRCARRCGQQPGRAFTGAGKGDWAEVKAYYRLFSDVEVEVLKAYAARQRLEPPESLGPMVCLVTRLGGYLGRKNDPPPGHQIMWEGHTQLHFMSLGYELRSG